MSPEAKRKLEYSHLQNTPNDGKRYELVHGELLVNPAPSMIHQRVSRRLLRQLEDYFHDRSIGEVFHAPFDVILTPHDVFEPDLLVVTDHSRLSNRGVEGPPGLVVEILSPSTRRIDREVKFRRSAELRVPHYWIVDPDAERVECYRLTDGAYRMIAEGRGSTTILHPDWDGLVIDLTALWNQSPFS
jgi:Uma2 family endonuclease